MCNELQRQLTEPKAERSNQRRVPWVLVVDDHVEAAESLAMLLRLWGHAVYVAHDGSGGAGGSAVHAAGSGLLDTFREWTATRRPGGSAAPHPVKPLLWAITGTARG